MAASRKTAEDQDVGWSVSPRQTVASVNRAREDEVYLAAARSLQFRSSFVPACGPAAGSRPGPSSPGPSRCGIASRTQSDGRVQIWPARKVAAALEITVSRCTNFIAGGRLRRGGYSKSDITYALDPNR